MSAWCKKTGGFMPNIGFGTFRVNGQALITEVLDYALGAGYRLIDTAVVYGNEKEIGVALGELLPKYNLERKDICITSKLPPNVHGNSKVIHEVIQKSLKNLNVSYIDIYLIHWPGQQGKSVQDKTNAQVRDSTWRALIEAREHGWVKHIGVSNYTVVHLQELIDNNHGVMPCLNQVEWHPFYHQPDLLELCKNNNIVLQAYCSFGGTLDSAQLLDNPTVVRIAKTVSKTPAQVLLAWALQQGVAVIPKSLRKEHIVSNIDIHFQMPAQDFALLSNMPQRKFAWNPTVVS